MHFHPSFLCVTNDCVMRTVFFCSHVFLSFSLNVFFSDQSDGSSPSKGAEEDERFTFLISMATCNITNFTDIYPLQHFRIFINGMQIETFNLQRFDSHLFAIPSKFANPS